MADKILESLQVLGLSLEEANKDEITRAFRKQALRLHPDKTQNDTSKGTIKFFIN